MQYKMSHPDLAGISVNHFDLVCRDLTTFAKNPITLTFLVTGECVQVSSGHID